MLWWTVLDTVISWVTLPVNIYREIKVSGWKWRRLFYWNDGHILAAKIIHKVFKKWSHTVSLSLGTETSSTAWNTGRWAEGFFPSSRKTSLEKQPVLHHLCSQFPDHWLIGFQSMPFQWPGMAVSEKTNGPRSESWLKTRIHLLPSCQRVQVALKKEELATVIPVSTLHLFHTDYMLWLADSYKIVFQSLLSREFQFVWLHRQFAFRTNTEKQGYKKMKDEYSTTSCERQKRSEWEYK